MPAMMIFGKECLTNEISVEEKSSKRIAHSQFPTLSNLNSTCFTVLPLLVEKSLEHVHLLSLFQGLGVARVLKRTVHSDPHFIFAKKGKRKPELSPRFS